MGKKILSKSVTIKVSAASSTPVPAWLNGVAINQWKEIPNSSMSVVPTGMVATGTNPAHRMDAWNGFAIKGTQIFCVRQGGHGDYFGNEVIKIDLSSNTPTWNMIKDSTKNPNVVLDNSSRYTDGSPSAVHGYYTQRFVPQRNWIFSVGTTAMSRQGGTNSDCVVYDIATNSYLPQGTVPDMPAVVLAEFGVFDDLTTGDIYQVAGYNISRWNQSTNTWSKNIASVPKLYAFPCVACTDTKRRRALMMAGDAAARQPYTYDIATQTVTAVNPSGELGPVNSSGHYGLVYCPVTDRFYALLHSESAGLYEINPTTFAISKKVTTGFDSVPASAPTGVFTRFLYVPELGGIAYFPKYSANAWFLKLHHV